MNIDIEDIINNASHIINQKYKKNPNKKLIRQILISFINNCLEYFKKNPPLPPIQEINRRAIAHIIDVISNQQNEDLDIKIQPRFPEEIQKLEKPLPPITNTISNSDQLNDFPKTELIEKDENSEDIFMKKLEELEITRNTINTSTPAPSPLSEIKSQQTLSQPIQQPIINAVPTVIYVPTKSKLSDLKQIIINSYDRDWSYSSNRSIFLYSGPLPSSENLKLGFAGIFLPKIVATLTPIIIIEIEGAGGQKQNILCHLTYPGVIWDMWNNIKTSDSKDAQLKNIACPWTIKLFDIYNNLLDLGYDGQLIDNVDTLLNKNCCIELNNDNNDLENNNIITIKKNNTYYGKFKIIGKSNKKYQIEGIENNKNYNELQNGLICNLTKQIIMIIELKKNELKS